MAFVCERSPCSRAEKTVTMASRSLLRFYTISYQQSILLNTLSRAWKRCRQACNLLRFALSISFQALSYHRRVLLHSPLFLVFSVSPGAVTLLFSYDLLAKSYTLTADAHSFRANAQVLHLSLFFCHRKSSAVLSAPGVLGALCYMQLHIRHIYKPFWVRQ